MMYVMTREQRVQQIATQLKYWARNRQRGKGLPVTGDELIERAKRRQPDLTNDELDYIYQVAG